MWNTRILGLIFLVTVFSDILVDNKATIRFRSKLKLVINLILVFQIDMAKTKYVPYGIRY